MINAHYEKLITLKEAARKYPGRTGKGVDTSTIWRWALRGIGGIRLEIIKVGGQTYTSLEALQRFHGKQNGMGDGLDTPQEGPKPSRDDRQAKADDSAESMGF